MVVYQTDLYALYCRETSVRIRFKPSYILIIIVIIFIILTLSPLKFPYSINTYAKLYPSEKWVLVKNPNGQLVSSTFDYRTGLSSGYDLTSFSGDGLMKFIINPALIRTEYVSAGDTLGRIYSSVIEDEITDLRGELEIARANLAVYASGDNLPYIRQLEKELDYVHEEIAAQKVILNRQKSLLDANLITREDFEIEESKSNLLQIKSQIAQARLKDAESGQKPETVEMVRRQIRALKDRLAVIQNRQDSYIIVTPLSGRLSKYGSGDTVLTICTTDSFVAVFPVESEQVHIFHQPNDLKVELNLAAGPQSGSLLNYEKQIKLIDNHPVVYASALFSSNFTEILPGMYCRCQVKCGRVGFYELAKRSMTSLLR